MDNSEKRCPTCGDPDANEAMHCSDGFHTRPHTTGDSDLVERVKKLRRTHTQVKISPLFGGALGYSDGETREVPVNPDGPEAADFIEATLSTQAAEIERLRVDRELHDLCATTEADAVSGLRYIEKRYGRLEGVGWDRVFEAHDKLFALARQALSDTSGSAK